MIEFLLDNLFRGIEFLADNFLIWGPIILLIAFINAWKAYLRSRWLLEFESVLLEVRLPREINKSPLAMELFLNHLFHPTGESTWKDFYWKGSARTWFSLELVSIEGEVKFFIWTEKKNKRRLETQIYAQYPNVEVVEVEDYTENVGFDLNEIDLTGAEFKLTKDDEYPIKTYVDYGLDKDPKEEFKIDPISPVIEFLGSLKKGEQAWFQILVRAHKKKKKGMKLLFFREETSWQDEGEELIKKLMKRDEKTKKAKEGEKIKFPDPLSQREQDVVEAVQRNLAKTSFDVGIRCLYFAPEEDFDKGAIGGIIGSWSQYNSNDLNGFKHITETIPSFTYKIQDPRGKRVAKIKSYLFNSYIRRSYFYPPHIRKPFVLSTEELATIYHFPGETVTTPTFERIESKKSEPPRNLPQ